MSGELASLDGASVVVRGLFTPALFSPAWLLSQELIGRTEYEAAEIDVITPDFASFSTSWLGVNVTSDALQVNTADVTEFDRLRDAARGIIRALVNTPIASLGINRDTHFAVGSEAHWHAVGDMMTPKEHWNSVLEAPGLRNVTVWGERPDGYKGRIQVQVEPSFRIPQAVFVGHNDHFDLAKTGDKRSSRMGWPVEEQPTEPLLEKRHIAIDILTENWQDSLQRAEDVFGMVKRSGKIS